MLIDSRIEREQNRPSPNSIQRTNKDHYSAPGKEQTNSRIGSDSKKSISGSN